MSLITSQALGDRPAHSYPGSLYLLPSDEEERQRLLAQHQLYTRLLSGRLILAPTTFSDKDEVLDLGTGGGAWLCNARAHLPESVQLYGVDIESRLFPPYKVLSANVHFSVGSATDLPSYWSSKFALVHQRLLILAYTREQWCRGIAEMYRVLVPGGYAQLIENGPDWVSGSKTATHLLFMDDFLMKKGMLMRCGVYIADMMKAAGFVDVKCEDVTMNLGKWAGEDGIQARDATIGAWKGMRDSVMREGGLDRFTTEEFDRVTDEVAEEWDNIQGSYTVVKVVYGRKPIV